jgi:hypothetical protein
MSSSIPLPFLTLRHNVHRDGARFNAGLNLDQTHELKTAMNIHRQLLLLSVSVPGTAPQEGNSLAPGEMME